MRGDYLKISTLFRFKKRANPLEERREAVRKEYSELLEKLSDIRRNFDFAEDESCVDALIFEENAVVKRLEKLICEAKESGLSIEFYEIAKK
ncbi:MAG: hypothetical protein MSH49_01120 [[Eubacterium] saphenum]|nr:hypothetical protein [[Eubacterium] saphenum]